MSKERGIRVYIYHEDREAFSQMLQQEVRAFPYRSGVRKTIWRLQRPNSIDEVLLYPEDVKNLIWLTQHVADDVYWAPSGTSGWRRGPVYGPRSDLSPSYPETRSIKLKFKREAKRLLRNNPEAAELVSGKSSQLSSFATDELESQALLRYKWGLRHELVKEAEKLKAKGDK